MDRTLSASQACPKDAKANGIWIRLFAAADPWLLVKDPVCIPEFKDSITNKQQNHVCDHSV